MPAEDENREQGVEFGSFADELENEEYPMSADEIREEYGDREVDLQDESQPVSEILDLLEGRTFESADDVKQGVIGMVGDNAIGRKNYTDRGGVPSEDGPDEQSL